MAAGAEGPAPARHGTAALYEAIDRHFLTPEALLRAGLLARHGRGAAEGWFKGEMLAVLDRAQRDSTVDGWRADVQISEEARHRCDFKISLAGGNALWLEVKALVDPARQAADLGFLGKGAAFTDDIVKLMRVPAGERAVLLFVLPRPSAAEWADLLATYSRRIAPLAFREESDVSAYPEPLYVCKLGIKETF